jgi:hypothetical protein
VSKNTNADLRSLFECAGVLLPREVRPGQSAAHVRRDEGFLILALLADAIDIFLNDNAERGLLAETRTWIQGATPIRR